MSSYLKFLSRNKLYTVIEAVGLAVSLAFVVTVLLSFAIAIGSVLWQIVSVARVNPVWALKKE